MTRQSDSDARQSFVGSYIPFPKSRILELYRDENDYLGRYAAAAMKLIDERGEELGRMWGKGGDG